MVIASVMLLLLLGTGRPFSRPVADLPSISQVREVMPGSGPVHENLLRFSVRFTKPQDGPVLRQLRLVRLDGTVIDEPFLNQELWSPDGKTLTVVLGPGRVKTGLIAHDTLGRPLHSGEKVVLEMRGQPIARWQVIDQLIHPIEPRKWRIDRPDVQTRDSLELDFPDPIDGMDTAMIVVVRNGHKVAGRAALSEDQKKWFFQPAETWKSGSYAILVHPHIEDPYGNELGSAFETPSPEAQHSERHPAELSFVPR